MSDPIFLVDPATKSSVKVAPVSFHELGVRETNDLERWIINHPEILGEVLLPITSQFSRFDKCNRRLDILALDVNGVLVVIELKLDAAGSWADQQAIRYAAFCSNLTMADVVAMFSQHHGCAQEDAMARINRFLSEEELPEISEQPRIILAAGSIDDQELTSAVLWLRRFGMDITCIELCPYRLADSDKLVLVPRIIIPLPETKRYQIGVEKKDAARIKHSRESSEFGEFWNALAMSFNALNVVSAGVQFKTTTGGHRKSSWKPLRFGRPNIHYEWSLRKSESRLDICLHLESDNRELNLRWLEPLLEKENAIRKGIDLEYDAEPWGRNWAQARFRIPFDGNLQEPVLINGASQTMKLLVERTYPLIAGFDL